MQRGLVLRLAFGALCLALLGTAIAVTPSRTVVHFAAVGNFGESNDAAAVLGRLGTLDTDLTLALGDLGDGRPGDEGSWCSFVRSKLGDGVPFELLAGDQESKGINGRINDYAACLPNQVPGAVGSYGEQYYLDVPAVNPLVRFVMISPGLAFPAGLATYQAGTARYAWTSNVIDEARDHAIPWVVVAMHKPCLTIGKASCEVSADLMNLLVRKKVDLILSAHEHSYQRLGQLALGPNCSAITPGRFDAGCVASSDDAMVKGQGTVSVIAGTGGSPLQPIDLHDGERGYVTASSGLNANPTWGVLDVTVSRDQLAGGFLPVSGGNFTDSFSISRGSAHNAPPVAAFVSSCTNLACSLDASRSTDSDGTPSGFSWDFGDGGRGTGSLVVHTFPRTGTFSVTLTVTDDRGGQGKTVQLVVVTAPSVITYASDDFERSVTDGLGSAPSGGAWSLSGDPSQFSVSGGVGRMTAAAGGGAAARLSNVSARDLDLRVAIGADKVPRSGPGLFITITARSANLTAYGAKPWISPEGQLRLDLTRRTSNGSEVILKATGSVPSITYEPGEMYNVRLQVVGRAPTNLRAKIWRAGTPEPVAWQRTATDDTGSLQRTGSIGVQAFLPSSTTNGPITVMLDDLVLAAP